MSVSKTLNALSRSALLVHTPMIVTEPDAQAGMDTAARTTDVLLLRKFAGAYKMMNCVSKTRNCVLKTMNFAGTESVWASAGLKTESFDMSRLVQAPSELPSGPLAAAGAAASAAWEELSGMLRRSKLVLTDSTTRRYWVPELSYAFGAGAVVVSDAPNENRRIFRHSGVELPRGTVSASDGSVPKGVLDLIKMWAGVDKAQARADKAAYGAKFARMNLSPTAMLETLLESYYEVISPPYGEGLVGKKYPWAHTVTCRSDGGEEWCDGAKKKLKTRRKYPHGEPAGGGGVFAKLFGGGRRLAIAPP